MREIKSRWHIHYVCDNCNVVMGTIHIRQRGKNRHDWINEYCPNCQTCAPNYNEVVTRHKFRGGVGGEGGHT